MKKIILDQEVKILDKEKEIYQDILDMYFIFGWLNEDTRLKIFEKKNR